MTVPLVSVVMPVFNAEKYLSQAIESILNQTFQDFEFIIINDGSTDNSLNIINKYIKEDQRIRFINRENKGLVASLNEGIQLAKGQFIARMDADDISHLNRLEEQVCFLENNKQVKVVSTGYQPISESGSFLGGEVIHPSDYRLINLLLVYCCPVCHPAVMVHSECLVHNKYEENIAAEDHQLWCQIAKNNIISNIEKSLIFYRVHSSSLTQRNTLKIKRSTYINGVKFLVSKINEFSQISLDDIEKLDKDKVFSSINWNLAKVIISFSKVVNKINASG